MKLIAFYLPQYYAFPENDKWWGEGFTEWTNVRKSKPLYPGHYQPTVPLNQNYYTLNDPDVLKWQTALAKKYGVYGFCFYHYWFGENRMLMEKPVEMFLAHSEIEMPFCLSWANHNWTRTWTGGDHEILMDVRYGGEKEWESHFEYLFPYFSDPRYICIDEKPVLVIYKPDLVPELEKMKDFLQEKAKKKGLNGITFISQEFVSDNEVNELMDYHIQYEPAYSIKSVKRWHSMKIDKGTYPVEYAADVYKHDLGCKIKKLSGNRLCRINTYSYDKIWKYIIERPIPDKKAIAGCFVNCDVTPRRQDRAVIYKGATPEKFGKYLKQLVKKINESDNIKYLFVSAWNEWGEGMYLEPDELHRYAYLEAVKDALER